MKRDHIVDLTSLLDIMLILLFAFMINMAGNVREQEKTSEDSKKTNEALQSELDQKNLQVQELEEQLAQDQVQMLELQNRNSKEATLLKEQLETLSEWMGNHEKVVDPEVLNDTIQKYEAISKFYVFVDIQLQTGDSHIFVNGEDTGIYILEQELTTPEMKATKQSVIEELIANHMDNIKGGYSFALITLSEDGQVKRAQYNLVWEAVKAAQQKKDSDKVFITQIQSLKP
ncbi:MAG: hypothetical protein H7X94_00645 [Vallitaleaceae bacterium]|nr:hypothetical protein [Vallitaleaceae bacterium]